MMEKAKKTMLDMRAAGKQYKERSAELSILTTFAPVKTTYCLFTVETGMPLLRIQSYPILQIAHSVYRMSSQAYPIGNKADSRS